MTDSITPQSIDFYVDEMLQGLIRWLRFLGYSALMTRNKSAFPENPRTGNSAVLLTASQHNIEKYGFSHSYLVKSDHIADQLQELNEQFDIFGHINFLSRCSRCNAPMQKVQKEAVSGMVPKRIYEKTEDFRQCPVCGHIYWKGGHVIRLKDKLHRMGINLNDSENN